MGVLIAILASGLTAGCDGTADLDPPTRFQITCAPATGAAADEVRVLVLDTGDRSVRWVNGPGAPSGYLSREDHQYLLRVGDGASAWRAVLNRFDGSMVVEAGRPATRRRLACVRETEGPKL